MQIMDEELEELESLFSEHFGRTPTASQASDIDILDVISDEESISGDTDLTSMEDVNTRTHAFIQENADTSDITQAEDYPALSDPLEEKVRDFMTIGCGCSGNCTESLDKSDIYIHILNIREMDKSEKEMYIMATLSTNTDKDCTKRGKKRQRRNNEFTFKGKKVCKKTFQLLFDIGKHSLQNIVVHKDENGVTPRTHKNTGRKPSKSLQFPDIRNVVQFLSNYADDFGIPQPAAPRGRDNTAPVYLPSSTLKSEVHERYIGSCSESNPPHRAVKYSTFNNIWRSCLAHIKIASPRDDVCAICEKLRKTVQDARSEEEKLECATNLREYVLAAQKERDVYNDCIKSARDSYINTEGTRYTHYTFDFCQNVSLPHHARQMGPVYFATLRKVQLFGFRIDGVTKQLNFLIDENETIGPDGSCTHGPNAVISMIHWAMQAYGGNETSCTIHADNCPGQNKNRYVIGYLMWRVMTGRHEHIEYRMQIPGHARCLVDSGFASLKNLYRRCDCDTIDQLEDVVNKSSKTNAAVRYPAWEWMDWKAFLEPVIRPIVGIRKYQYFRMTSEKPGELVVKQSSDGEEKTVFILRQRAFEFQPDTLPTVIPPACLSQQRQEYLYKTVRPFVRPCYQDATCPAPDQNT